MSPSANRSWQVPFPSNLPILIILGAAVLWVTALVMPNLRPTPIDRTPEFPAVVTGERSIPVSPRNFVAAAVNRVGAAVVRIEAELTSTPRFQPPLFDPSSPQRPFGEDRVPEWPREYRSRGQESGFIVDSDGTILTNAHVVKGANIVTVTLKDGRTFRGEVLGTDGPSDLAVIKIEGENLPVAPLGQSHNVQVGDWAIALGNPMGLDNTVSFGIISAVSRSSATIGIPDMRVSLLQTDAAINPGNSGGPLLNQDGEVIGIISMMRPNTEGIGFAIPIDRAIALQGRLAKGERIPHPYIGVRLLNLTPEIARSYNNSPNLPFVIPEINGCLVLEVAPNSPAAEAGLQKGDVIVEIDGREIVDLAQFQTLVESCSIGKAVMFEVQRGDELQQFSIRPEELLDTRR